MRPSSSSRRVNVLRVHKIPSGPCPRKTDLGIPRPSKSADERGQLLLSRTAVSEITQRLWTEYEAFASRDLSEFEVIYLFVGGLAERLHLGQPREAVLAAWGRTGGRP